jgi:hypothetical protein
VPQCERGNRVSPIARRRMPEESSTGSRKSLEPTAANCYQRMIPEAAVAAQSPLLSSQTPNPQSFIAMLHPSSLIPHPSPFPGGFAPLRQNTPFWFRRQRATQSTAAEGFAVPTIRPNQRSTMRDAVQNRPQPYVGVAALGWQLNCHPNTPRTTCQGHTEFAGYVWG